MTSLVNAIKCGRNNINLIQKFQIIKEHFPIHFMTSYNPDAKTTQGCYKQRNLETSITNNTDTNMSNKY